MKRDWSSLVAPSFLVPEPKAKIDVLVEYDGPQLILRGQNLGLLADADRNLERWLLTNVTKLELEALALGALPMRDIFSRKNSITVVDFAGLKSPRHSWTITPEQVPPGILPTPKAALPTSARAFLQKKLKMKPHAATVRRLRFAGMPVHGSAIEFSALSKLVGSFQEILTSIGQALGIHAIATDGLPSTTLLAGATSEGSFAIHLHASDQAVLDKVLERYRSLVTLAHENVASFAEEVTPESQLGREFEAYFGDLADLKAESLIEIPGATVYVGPAYAQTIRVALKRPRKPRVTAPTLPHEVTVQRGYFDRFAADDATFAFFDIDSGRQRQGTVSASLKRKVSDQGSQEAAVGRITMYRATIEHHGSELVLVAFDELGQAQLKF